MKMSEDKNYSMEKFLDTLGEILAYFTAILYAVLIINANFNFIPADVLYYLRIAQIYAPIALLTVVGLEFSVKRNLVVRIIFYIVIAIIIIFQFFPDTWTNFIAALK